MKGRFIMALRKTIGRTLPVITISVATVKEDSNGELQTIKLDDLVVSGNATNEFLNKYAQKHYADQTGVIVTRIKKELHYYEMPIENFIANAEIKDEKLTEKEDN